MSSSKKNVAPRDVAVVSTALLRGPLHHSDVEWLLDYDGVRVRLALSILEDAGDAVWVSGVWKPTLLLMRRGGGGIWSPRLAQVCGEASYLVQGGGNPDDVCEPPGLPPELRPCFLSGAKVSSWWVASRVMREGIEQCLGEG